MVRCCYAVAKEPGLVARVLQMRFLGYLGRLLGCCYAVARVPGVVAIRLLWYSGVVAKVLLRGCYGTQGGC